MKDSVKMDKFNDEIIKLWKETGRSWPEISPEHPAPWKPRITARFVRSPAPQDRGLRKDHNLQL